MCVDQKMAENGFAGMISLSPSVAHYIRHHNNTDSKVGSGSLAPFSTSLSHTQSKPHHLTSTEKITSKSLPY